MQSARRFFSRTPIEQATDTAGAEPAPPATVARPKVLRIEARLYQEMIEHLREVHPHEGCGLIAFSDGEPVKIYPGTNILRSSSRYRMSDLEVLRAVDDMDRQGWWLGAIYHSHPNSQPVPSATDLREANWPEALMLIASRLTSETPDLRAYRMLDNGLSYEEVSIDVYVERIPWLATVRRNGFGRSARAAGQRRPRRVVWKPVGFDGTVAVARGSEGSTMPELAIDDTLDFDEDGEDRRAVIGILGGMGPLATADLYQKIIEFTPAASDQEHIPVVIYADPRVPDRTEALLRDGEDPTPWLVHGARTLTGMGADFIVMPCNTAHAFLDGVQPAVDKPIMSMIDAAADEIRKDFPEATTVGLLATSGTITSEIYQRALQARGVDVIVPDDDLQRRCVMAAIREVKAGRTGPAATALLAEAARQLSERGADVLLAACTEIPVIFQQQHTETPLVDATGALARIAVETARHLDELAKTGSPQWETSTSGWGIEPGRLAGR
ncbi:MAG TPA: amino acid racemase [Thermomicrobiales bacterium]|nr:amino acid racemase [Thermomicrobiales bacterium]